MTTLRELPIVGVTGRRVLTISQLGTLNQCQRKYQHSYVEKLRPMIKPSYFSEGTAYHLGIEHRDPAKAVAYIREEAGKPWAGFDGRQAMHEALISTMVRKSLERWTEWASLPEVKFRVPLRNPETGRPSRLYCYAGIWDGIELGSDLLGNQTVLIDEYKTTSQLNESYWIRVKYLDGQVTGYIYAASEYFGVPVEEISMRYRVAKKTSLRMRRGETPMQYDERCSKRAPLKARPNELPDTFKKRQASRKPLARKVAEDYESYTARVIEAYEEDPGAYLQERTIRRTQAQVDEWLSGVWASLPRIRDVWAGAPTPKNTQACLARGKCQFLELCAGQVTKDAYRTTRTTNPELSE